MCLSRKINVINVQQKFPETTVTSSSILFYLNNCYQTRWYSIHTDIKQGKTANPHTGESGASKRWQLYGFYYQLSIGMAFTPDTL